MLELISDRRGATSIEYGLLAVLIVIIITSGISTVGENVSLGFDKAGAAMASPAQEETKNKSKYLIVTNEPTTEN